MFVLAAVLPGVNGWQRMKENECLDEGERLLKWVLAEKAKTGQFPSSLAGSGVAMEFRWSYDPEEGAFFLYTRPTKMRRRYVAYHNLPGMGWEVESE